MAGDSQPTASLPRVVGVPSSSPSSAVPDDRRARQEWITQQLEDRKKRCAKEDQDKELGIQQLQDKLWRPFAREAAQTHELNIAWKQDKGFFTWDRVLTLGEELEALRITGFELHTMPSQLMTTLATLTTLSLIACQLETLPDNIGDLKSLTELDLTKNHLTYLPDSLTTIVSLRQLNLSSNWLVELPADFGNLCHLDKLWCENNRLVALPDTIARSTAHTANFTNNQLASLPDAIGEMVNLVHLSVNLNQLVQFPDTLANCTALQSLHASRNKLVALPRNIGNLAALRDLRLDWNQIKELPFSFRLLRSLQTLCMERNPLKLPPIEYIARGVPATMLYMERSLEEFIRKSRRQVVEKLQQVLTFAMRVVDELHAAKATVNATVSTTTTTTTTATATTTAPGSELSAQDKADIDLLDALFEPRVERLVRQTEKLQFFGVVWSDDSFFDQLLPVLERRSPQPLGLLQLCSRDEIQDALQQYDDFFGPASMADDATEFRKCLCIDEIEFKYNNGATKRKVCVPRQFPYRCQRKALLIRMTMMTTEEAKDQLASTYLKRKIERLSLKTKRKCVEYINSEPGVLHFEKLAIDLATKHCKRRKKIKKLRIQYTKTKSNLEKKKAKLQARADALVQSKRVHRKAMEDKLEALRKERVTIEETKNAKKATRVDQKITELEHERQQEPVEDRKLLEVELAIEGIDNAEAQALVDFEKAKEIEMNDGQPIAAEEMEEEEEEIAVDGGEEGEGEEDEEESESGESEPEDGEDEEGEEENAEQVAVVTSPESGDSAADAPKFFDIEMPDLHVEDYRRVTTHAIENAIGEERDVNHEELLILYQQQLRDAYVAEKCALVEKRATYEFVQMRAVLKRWMGLGTRSIFESWRDVAKANKANAEQIQAKKVRKKVLDEQNKVLAEQLARVEARKWLEKVDMYTDAVYFEHSESGETSWTPPVYWEEEQSGGSANQRHGAVPLLKLPPI